MQSSRHYSGIEFAEIIRSQRWNLLARFKG
jgi:hypothetical protein